MGTKSHSPLELETPSVEDQHLVRSALGWAMYDVGRFPIMTLVIIFVFVPYFATSIAPNPVAGQALTAQFSMIAGLIAAPTAPLLGAVIDRLGPCKPWLVPCITVLIFSTSLLWFVQPGPNGLPIIIVMGMLTIISLFLTYFEVLGNSMLAALPHGRVRTKTSGFAIAAGSFLSLILMLWLLWGFLLPGTSKASWLPVHPLFNLQKESFQNVRVVSLVAATSLLITAVPFILLSKDRHSSGLSISKALKGGIYDIFDIIKNLRKRRDPAIYILARTIFQDASTAVMQLIGVYVAGTMGWHASEMTIYGIICVVMGGVGGLLASRLDSILGPKRALQLFVFIPAFCLFCELGTNRTEILYLWTFHSGHIPMLWSHGIFKTLPELVFLVFGGISSAAQVATLSSTRTLLISLLRKEEVATWFGLAALTGASTAWIGPMFVGLFTLVFSSQQLGFAPLILMLIIGGIILGFIHGGGPEIKKQVF